MKTVPVALASQLIPGQPAQVAVTASLPGLLDAWLERLEDLKALTDDTMVGDTRARRERLARQHRRARSPDSCG